MSTENKVEELDKAQLSKVAGGEEGGSPHENEESISSGTPSEGLLGEKDLSNISGGSTETEEETRIHKLEFDPEAKG